MLVKNRIDRMVRAVDEHGPAAMTILETGWHEQVEAMLRVLS